MPGSIKKGPKKMLQQVRIEVTDASGKNRRHWDDGTTTVYLYPEYDPVLGTWESDRPGDLESDAEDAKRTYDFSTTKKVLGLRIFSEDKKKGKDWIRGQPVTTVLTLDRFNINTPLPSTGKGFFHFRGHNLPVNWTVRATVEVKKRDDDSPQDKVILSRRYRLRPNDPSFNLLDLCKARADLL